MGYNLEEIDNVLFDTSSGWTMVATSDCTDCTTTTYDYTASPDTYKEMDTLDADVSVTSLDLTKEVDGL